MKKYVFNKNMEHASMGSELGLLDIESGKYFVLNEVSYEIWKILASEKSVAEVVSELLLVYDIDEETCYSETSSAIKTMFEKHIILEA